ncbi:hypothetical protein [Mycolicibacterium llatzerense]|uniref:hypothetical protein n=1 Tax=Mycolicibacterium llatzerense TaxID=280871 RepID=UPI0021B4EB69|nr:hypothetical protein [Mycolicibacterium llatzerense]MCT7372728.1 hypothetical protein [Mycolicibacterium llatzerense]
MKFNGDKTATLFVGQVLGPGNDGLMRQITDVWFDEEDGATYVDADVVQQAPAGSNLRYWGSQDPQADVPEVRERIPDKVTPR